MIAGPLLGMVHVATADRDDYSDEPVEVTVAAATKRIAPDPLVTPGAASARAFHNWRDSSNPVLERRERERRAQPVPPRLGPSDPP